MKSGHVCCVCCTYGRFNQIKNSLAYWLNQKYDDTSLIIYNTHPTPIVLASGANRGKDVTVVNAPGEYTSLGDVRNKALTYAKGDWYVCWDDDDIFLPWHIDLGISHLMQHPESVSWHPTKSLWSPDGGTTYVLAQNNFEAAWITRMDFIKQHGHAVDGQSGGENLGWLLPLQSTGLILDINTHPLESYAYVWGNGLHHISSWESPSNFESHLQTETDDGRGVELTPADPADTYKKYLTGLSVGGEYTPEEIEEIAERFRLCGIDVPENTDSLPKPSSITKEEWEDSQRNEIHFWTTNEYEHGHYEIKHRLPYYLSTLFPELRSPINGKLIDVGCGPCSIFRVLSGTGTRIQVDPILDATLSKAYTLGGNRVQARGESLPFKSNEFDAAFCLNCLDHVQSPLDVVSEIHRILRVGGHLYLVVDLKDPGMKDSYHKIVFNQEEVDDLLGEFTTVRQALVPHGVGNPAVQYVKVLRK